jgi:hypothetical protein
LKLFAQFGNDFFQTFGLKDVHSFAERSQRRAWTIQLSLHVSQLTGLLDGSQRADERIEEEQQHHRAILVHVQKAIAGPVSFAADTVQSFQQRLQLVEVLQSDNIFFVNFFALLSSHAPHYAHLMRWRNTTSEECDTLSNLRAEQDCRQPVNSVSQKSTSLKTNPTTPSKRPIFLDTSARDAQ